MLAHGGRGNEEALLGKQGSSGYNHRTPITIKEPGGDGIVFSRFLFSDGLSCPAVSLFRQTGIQRHQSSLLNMNPSLGADSHFRVVGNQHQRPSFLMELLQQGKDFLAARPDPDFRWARPPTEPEDWLP